MAHYHCKLVCNAHHLYFSSGHSTLRVHSTPIMTFVISINCCQPNGIKPPRCENEVATVRMASLVTIELEYVVRGYHEYLCIWTPEGTPEVR